MRHLAIVSALCFLAACGKTGTSPPHLLTGGDWISSGGETLRDAHNPWWLKNVSDINYCVEVDTASISAPVAKIEEMVKVTIDYWKKEFTRKVTFFDDPFHQLAHWNSVGVGTQNFHKVPCSGAEDLRLQFGYGTLTQTQKGFMKAPLRFVAVAVRTHYDAKALRGKGFIFVGSDIGPNRFAPETQAERVWSFESALTIALLHELGHVFGIPHLGNRYSLMGAGILELFTHKAMAPFLGKMNDGQNDFTFFMPPTRRRGCTPDEKQKELWQKYFELEHKPDCLTFQYDEAAKHFTVQAHDEKGLSKMDAGGIDSLTLKMGWWPTSGVIIFLNPLQLVFPGMDPNLALGLQMGPYFVAGQGGGRLLSKKGNTKLLHLQLGPEEWTMSGEHDGRHQAIVNWSTKPY